MCIRDSYIRAFHASKTINPATGRRNPTITNNSWGYSNFAAVPTITEIFYRGATIPGPFTLAQLANYGLFTSNYFGTNYVVIPARVGAVEEDIVDAIADGIIVVGAAGNNSATLGAPLDADWNNYIRSGGNTYYTCLLYTSPSPRDS